MKRKILIIGFIFLLSALVLSACAGSDEKTSEENADTEESSKNMDKNEEDSDSMEEGMDHSKMNDDMEGHMDHDEVVSLNDSTGENELKMPPVLESDSKEEVAYTVRAKRRD
ncbi:hypothetical protein P5G51_019250 [Virgibacillus sp. 179-BFC.A HS]|uniref:Uncharacterized protein n=1 Tax=Tigheibacillus jepli TaxID=3035914 RepID=A0ABU5CLE6_9BACI|nr:hypothetical protein [Virgibacillus sp. 179-BFC.A HS]MDY0407181.1 hypothetical protein [Virgibacillus sp. 179-BFC.A HS]